MEFSSHYRKGNGTRKGNVCCVVNCDSKKNINTNLSFHKVPKFGSGTVTVKNLVGGSIVVDKRSEWLKRLKIQDTDQQILVCSLHFSVDDYVFPDIPIQRRHLKKNAVPVPISVSLEKRKNDIKRIKRLNARRNIDVEKETEANDNQSVKEIIKNSSESDTVPNLISPSVSNDVLSDMTVCDFDRDSFKHCIDAGVSVGDMLKNINEPEHHDPGCEDSNLGDSINETTSSDDVQSIDSENSNEDKEHQSNPCNKCEEKTFADQSNQVKSGDFIVSFCTFIRTEQDLITMCNINSFSILDEMVESMEKCYPPKKNRIFTTRECIIFTTAKLKLDISFAALGVLFNQVCVVTLRNIFYDTVKKLATILQSVLTRVSKEEIMNNMSNCLKKYQVTTSVFDCTEIRIQQPKCLKCCLKFYSYYKGGLSVKFMTEVTPGGMIVGVSEGFGGRASDKSIFNQANVLSQLESTSDAIMVDKGRIKQFQILNNKLHWYLANYIDDIFIICCGLANLGTPILADVKFE